MRHCDWEGADFPTDQFDGYRGLIYLHKTAEPVHLTNGQLPDGQADAAGGDIGNVDVTSDEPEDGGIA